VLLETPAAKLEIRADAADVRLASLWLQQQGAARVIPPGQIFRLDICLNEALANVIEHGGPDAALAPVRLCLGADVDGGGGHATMMISDAGRAFNPLTVTPEALPGSLAQASPGGLGLGLMHSFADEVAYDHRQGRNCLQFVVHWSIDQ
jgi:anti-sigma regulatory factor (Ser/Thr protein kinase)